MFFLASYGMINYATYFEARAASTSFRPTFKSSTGDSAWHGTIACLGVVIAINPIAGSIAGRHGLGLYRYLRRTVREVRWADSTIGFHADRGSLSPAADECRDVRRGATGDRARWCSCHGTGPTQPPTDRRLVVRGGGGLHDRSPHCHGTGAVGHVDAPAPRVDLEMLQRTGRTATPPSTDGSS